MKEKLKKMAELGIITILIVGYIIMKQSGIKKNDIHNTKVAIKELLNNDSVSKSFQVPQSISEEFITKLNQEMINRNTSSVIMLDEDYIITKTNNEYLIATNDTDYIIITQPDSSNRVFIKNSFTNN